LTHGRKERKEKGKEVGEETGLSFVTQCPSLQKKKRDEEARGKEEHANELKDHRKKTSYSRLPWAWGNSVSGEKKR